MEELLPQVSEQTYPKALPGNYYGCSIDDLKDIFSGLWEDQLTIMVAHIIKNDKRFKNFDEQARKGVMLSTIKKIICKLWLDNNITMSEADNFYNMFVSPDDENQTVSVEILKSKFPKALTKLI